MNTTLRKNLLRVVTLLRASSKPAGFADVNEKRAYRQHVQIMRARVTLLQSHGLIN